MAVTFQQRTLSNGLTIVAETDPASHTAAAGFFVRTGARDEPGEIMGVSHFLEHMMFKGTAELSADDINRRFDEIGASNNAYTTHELTCFYAKVLPEHLERAIDTLGRMMRPALRQDDFDTEKGVILEEIAMYKDNPFWVLYEEASQRHYRSHPLGHRVLGTAETIRALSAEQMRRYFHDRYSADNTIVALAGRVDFDATCRQIDSLCGAWDRTGAARDSARPATGGGTFELRDPRINRAYILGLAEAPTVADDRRYAAALAAQILGGSDNSRLHWALIETGLAEEAHAGYEPHDGTGQWLVFASGDPGSAERTWSVVLREIRSLRDSLNEDDLMRLRSKLATAATVDGERPGDRMQRLGRLWTYLGEYRSLEEELARINAVTLDDLRAVCDEFPLTPTTTGMMLPAD